MNKLSVIVPCAGKSSRFPDLRPKFLLTNPSGKLMLFDSVSKLDLRECNLIITVLKEYEDKYGISTMIKNYFKKNSVKLCVLNKQTNSQSETAYQTILKEKIDGAIFIKDADNIFTLKKLFQPFNYITVDTLENPVILNPSNKSYVLLGQDGFVQTIEEKKVISNTFSIGGYYFLSAQQFKESFEVLNKSNPIGELYISRIIKYLIGTERAQFKIRFGSNYLDLGTVKDWLAYKDRVKTYFIDIDGIVVFNSSEFFTPLWGKTKGILENIDIINELYNLGNQIILITSRKNSFKKATIKQLKKYGVKYHKIIMDLYPAQRIIVNDFANSNPYPSAVAINIQRDSNKLSDYIKSLR